ncbi:MAG: TetR/AcrR family transcriptional regulator [Myxococcales bacterium]|nr:TetR/AcrR family transcriptional regulator [Myxococcales bacterium]
MNNDNIPRKAAYHHGNLRAALIKAALVEIAAEGPEQFSLRGVARRAGVSAPAVYRHFASKDDLLAAVAGECAERMGHAIGDAIAAAPPDDPLEQFRATGIAIVQFAVAHPAHFRAMNVPGMYDRLPPEQRAAQDEFVRQQQAALAKAQHDGYVAKIPLDEVMLAANSAVMGLAHAIIEGRLGPVDAARATKLATDVTHVLGVGLVPRPETITDPRTKAVTPKAKKGRYTADH